MFYQLFRMPLFVHLAATFLAFLGFHWIKGRLDASYAASLYPVDYASGQLAFDANLIEAYYAHMMDAGTLHIYWQTQFLDFGFIAAVMTVSLLLGALAARLGGKINLLGVWSWHLGRAAAILGACGASFDVFENLLSFGMLARPDAIAASLAMIYSTAAAAKFILLTLAMAAVLIAISTGVAARLSLALTKRRSKMDKLQQEGRVDWSDADRKADLEPLTPVLTPDVQTALARQHAGNTIVATLDAVVFEEVDYASRIASDCTAAFAAELSQRLNLTFDLKKSGDPELSQMKHPHGTFVVARLGEIPLGCVGIKGSGGTLAEVKRMWVAPAARGLGLARRLMTQAEDAARALGIDTLRLDTNSTLIEAVGLYHSMGWTEIERFNDDPYPDLFFEKKL